MLAAAFTLFSGGLSYAQTIVGAPPAAGRPGLRATPASRATFTPTMKFGYQKIGLDFNMPDISVLEENNEPEILAGVDFKLTRSNVWVGLVGAELALYPQLTLFAAGEACFRPDIGAETHPDVIFGPRSLMTGRSVTWTDSEFEHWIIDGGLCFMGPPWYGVVIGLRSDNLSLKLKAPGIQGLEPEEGETLRFYRADFQSKILLPYVGIQVLSANSKATLIGTRYFSGEITIPFRFGSEEGDGLKETENKFSLKGTNGLFVEGLFDYRLLVSSGLYVGVWGRGNVINITDKATRSSVESEAADTRRQSAEQTASFNRYVYGGGISTSIQF